MYDRRVNCLDVAAEQSDRPTVTQPQVVSGVEHHKNITVTHTHNTKELTTAHLLTLCYRKTVAIYQFFEAPHTLNYSLYTGVCVHIYNFFFFFCILKNWHVGLHFIVM